MRIGSIAANIAHDRKFAAAGVFFEEVLGHEFWNGFVEVDAVNENL